MDADVKQMIDRAFDEGSRGAYQPREVIIKMLELDPESEEAAYLKERACEMAHLATKNRGSLSGAIGVDLCSCDMNCKFCSFGTEWGLVEEEKTYTKEEIIELARAYVEAGVTTLTLRSTEFYDLSVLTEWLEDIRAAAPGDYCINLNVGEMTPAMAEAAYQAGATSAYHVMRMREGIDTPFAPEVRERTIRAISDSPLRYGTCVEPIGIEHTNEELADKILYDIRLRPYGIGVMFRVNVPGTPFEGYEDIPLARRLQILATVRLAVGTQVRSMGMHPAHPNSLYAGGSSFTLELGANPRDTEFNDAEWRSFKANEAKQLLEDAGFRLEVINPDPRFKDGADTWWRSGDPANYVMPDPAEGAGPGCCCGKRA